MAHDLITTMFGALCVGVISGTVEVESKKCDVMENSLSVVRKRRCLAALTCCSVLLVTSSFFSPCLFWMGYLYPQKHCQLILLTEARLTV